MRKKVIGAGVIALLLGWVLFTVAISVKFTHGDDDMHLWNNHNESLVRTKQQQFQFRSEMDHRNHHNHDSRNMPFTTTTTSRIRPQKRSWKGLSSQIQLFDTATTDTTAAAAAAAAADVPKTKNHSTHGAATVPLHPTPTTSSRQQRSTMCVSKPNDHCTLTPCTDHDTATDYGFLQYETPTARGRRLVVSGSAKAGSGCALSVKYRFLYIHVLKSGGMSIKAFLKNALCGTTVQPCPMGHDVLQIVDCASAIQKHSNDYFVFSFVRNPFSRLYSGYSMADSMRSRGPAMTTWKHYQKPEFTFSDFVMGSTMKRRMMSFTSPSHYLPQVSFLFDKESNCPVVDFIGRLERFQEDLQLVVSKIASPELQSYYNTVINNANQQQQHDGGGNAINVNNNTTPSAQQNLLLHESNTAYGKRKREHDLGGSLSNAFSTPELIEAAAKEFARDFRLLGYDPTVVP